MPLLDETICFGENPLPSSMFLHLTSQLIVL